MLSRLVRRPGVQRAGARALGRYLDLALRSTRWRLHGEAHVAPHIAGTAAVVAFWHERLPLMPSLWLLARRRNPGIRIHVLVSRHRDGRLIGALVRRFDVLPVHGSSSRGGAAGLRTLAALLAGGDLVAITPDGPRGPRRRAAPGVAQLAELAGVPVLACAAQTTRRITLNTWDGMVLPLPFGRGAIVCEPPIPVPRHGWQAALPQIEAALDRAADTANRLCGPRPPSARAYAAAATLVAPALGAMLRLRAAGGKEIAARLPERRGIEPTPRPAGNLLWLHAASVGETISVLPVLAALADKAPELTTLLTTGTVTSARLLAARLPELGLAGRVLHRFVPLDVPAWAARFLDHWRPDAAAFVESELWPNLLAACAARDIPTMLVNARLSPRSEASWSRAPGLARQLLQGFARIEARSEEDAARLSALGARAVAVPGDLKFAAPPLPADAAELHRLGESLNGRPVWLAGSTHPGEDEAVFAAHRALAPRHPGLLTILVPRHPERGPRIAALANGVPAPRRAAGAAPPEAGGIYVADTLGELGLWYRLAPVAFIGGSLVPHGGQNPLEAGRLGCAIAAGPHMGNFAAAVAALEQAGAIGRVADAAGLAAWVGAMLADPAQRRQMGEAARRAADRWADLPARCADSLLALLRRRAA